MVKLLSFLPINHNNDRNKSAVSYSSSRTKSSCSPTLSSSSFRSQLCCLSLSYYYYCLLAIVLFSVRIVPYTTTHNYLFANADFVYADFNQTLGLVFNGDATTADCSKVTGFVKHKPTPKFDDDDDESQQTLFQSGEDGDKRIKEITTTASTDDDDDEARKVRSTEAGFGHRDSFLTSGSDGCSTRLRLTPSHPSKVGSVWYEKRLPVLKGFTTTFSFRVTDQSQSCSYRADPTFSSDRHRSCVVHGGDGLAFVIHADPNATSALGGDGGSLGYGGMANALAVEFDLWTNAPTSASNDEDDLFEDHVSIHSAGPNGRIGRVVGRDSALGYARPATDLGDGKVHDVRIDYVPRLEHRYFPNMTANENLLPYLKDNGEGRRLGTLAVFLDGEIGKGDGGNDGQPVLAIPLNLSVLLDLPQSLAYVGFTASTGRKWEKHDVLRWKWEETTV